MKKNKIIIIVLLVLLIAVGSGVIVYFHFQDSEISNDNADLNNGYDQVEYPNDEHQNNENQSDNYESADYQNNGETTNENKNDEDLVVEAPINFEFPTEPFDPDLLISHENWPEDVPRYIPGATELQPLESLIIAPYGGSTFIPQHRWVYYIIPGRLASLVDNDDFMIWNQEWRAADTGDSRDQMMLVHFIRFFDISREEFEFVLEEMRADNDWRASRGTDLSCEMREIPNADIIFTFDPVIISYFFRRE